MQRRQHMELEILLLLLLIHLLLALKQPLVLACTVHGGSQKARTAASAAARRAPTTPTQIHGRGRREGALQSVR